MLTQSAVELVIAPLVLLAWLKAVVGMYNASSDVIEAHATVWNLMLYIKQSRSEGQ